MPDRWRSHLTALGLAFLAILILLRHDFFDMAEIWWNISTYNHMLFILPIIAWLIWQRKEELAEHLPRVSLPGLIAVVLFGILWALGEASGISVMRHTAVIGLVQSVVLTLLGPVIFRALLFPQFYLIFLIPLGEELVPLLQTITAQLCMVLLKLVSIPATIDGVFIRTPVGLFEVAEACSGVKFLVAMVAYAVLAANVCFVAWGRRIAFLIMAFIVPIFANGFRAFSTIWISELTGNTKFAGSFDHIIYGWVFFGLVMGLVMAIGWRWFDRRADDPWLVGVKPDGRVSRNVWVAGAAVFAVVLMAFASQNALASFGRRPMPREITLPDVPGWHRTAIVQKTAWTPRFDGADHFLHGQYADDNGDRVDLVIALYAWQEEKREMTGYAQGAFDPRTDWSWVRETTAPEDGKADRITATGVVREVASFYWIGNMMTGSRTTVKVETLKSRLTGQDQAAAAILVSAEEGTSKPSRPVIDAFLSAAGPVDQLAKRLILVSRGGK
jgi:exosortase A